MIPFGLGIDKQGINATQCARAGLFTGPSPETSKSPGGDIFSQAGDVGKIRDLEHLEINEQIGGTEGKAARRGRIPVLRFSRMGNELRRQQETASWVCGPARGGGIPTSPIPGR